MSWAGPNGNNNPFPRPGGPQPFWNWVHSFDPNFRAGAGVDHSAGPWGNGFPFHDAEVTFGGPAWGVYGGWGEPRRGGPGHRRGGGRCGSRGRPGRHDHRHSGNEGEDTAEDVMRDVEDVEISDKEKDDSPDTMRDSPEEGAREHGRPQGPGRRRGHFGRGEHWRHSRHHGPRGPHPPPPPFGAVPPPPPPYGGHPPPPPPPPGFDFTNFLNQFSAHPLAQNIRDWVSRFGGLDNLAGAFGRPDFTGDNDESSFTPPVDIFVTEKAYVLHFALPGAKKEDIGVDWDADKGELRVAGVVYRPGDEDFLATMASSERRVGMFSRSVPLPPTGPEREEIDALHISAKMEDGVLIVTVPKLEKEWTEIHKVDIE